MPYPDRLVSCPIQSGRELSWLVLRKSLLKKRRWEREALLSKNPRNPHVLHNRAFCECNAVSRSLPYGFHLSRPHCNSDIVSARNLREWGHQNTYHWNCLIGRITRVSTHLSGLELKTGGPKIRRNPKLEPSSTMGMLCRSWKRLTSTSTPAST